MSWTLTEANLADVEAANRHLDEEIAATVPWTVTPIGYACRDLESRFLGACLATLSGERALITALWVRPSARRQGLASSLVDRVLARALAADVCEVFVTCLSGTAVTFYSKQGFMVVFSTRLADGIEFVIMRREL